MRRYEVGRTTWWRVCLGPPVHCAALLLACAYGECSKVLRLTRTRRQEQVQSRPQRQLQYSAVVACICILGNTAPSQQQYPSAAAALKHLVHVGLGVAGTQI